MYDYVIVGAGPTGLTLAYILSKYNNKVLLLEKQSSVGGCHRVIRKDNLFTEHGPRVYMSMFKTFISLLNDMNIQFNDIFTPYKVSGFDLVEKVMKNLTVSNLFVLTVSFLNLNDSYKKVTMEEYLNKYNFSSNAKRFIDGLCRLSDGASIKRFTLYQFLDMFNNNLFNAIYQPKKPNDLGLFKLWTNKLVEQNVDIQLDSEVIDIVKSNEKIKSVVVNGKNIYGSNFIFAIPPKPLMNLLSKTNVKDAFGSFNKLAKFANDTDYMVYIPVMFYWYDKIKLKQLWGFPDPESKWGVISVVMSDYMDFDNYNTVISTCISFHNKSDYTDKTPHDSTKQELINEVFRQLKNRYPNLPKPDNAILNQNIYSNGKWEPADNAFVFTKYGHLKRQQSQIYNNMYNCGTHNGESSYSFTSMESAVVNAFILAHKLVPESKNKYIVKEGYTAHSMIKIIIVLIVAIVVFYFMYRL